jgi:hypothetical protein
LQPMMDGETNRCSSQECINKLGHRRLTTELCVLHREGRKREWVRKRESEVPFRGGEQENDACARCVCNTISAVHQSLAWGRGGGEREEEGSEREMRGERGNEERKRKRD